MRPFVFLLVLAAMPLARAVIVSGGDGLGNLTASGAGLGWDYVGAVNGASGVYLGSYESGYWALTAGHVGEPLGLTLNGVSYGAVAGSARSVQNSTGGAVDLRLFRIDGDPGLVNLSLNAGSPVGRSVFMIGSGINRATTETFWDIGWNETNSPILGVRKGYQLTGSAAKRWGTNVVTGLASDGTTDYLVTSFDRVEGDAQATVGDSGGGVFGADGTLVGIMLAVTSSASTGQPPNTSVYNNQTFSADISLYRSQILEIVGPMTPVPEPSIFALLAVAGLGAWLRTRRAAPR